MSTHGRDAVICQPLRTPVGRAGGVFRNVPAVAGFQLNVSTPGLLSHQR